MPRDLSKTAPQAPDASLLARVGGWPNVLTVLAFVGGLVYFLGYYRLFEANHGATAFLWLWKCWNSEGLDYEHGKLIPFAAAFLVWRQRETLAAAPSAPRNWGLLLVGVGVALYLASARTLQPRLALGAIPFLILGAAIFVRGMGLARLLVFPAFLVYFGIPVPGLIQATNGLQVIATTGAYHIVSAFGVDALASGNYIRSASDAWGFDVAEGCSGIRSLMALTLIAAVYAHLVHREFWKKVVLFFAAFPLAILANVVRVASIVLIGEYVSPEFAGDLYHDYSGFLFFPVGLAGLILCSKLLNFSEHFSRRTIRVMRGPRGAAAQPEVSGG